MAEQATVAAIAIGVCIILLIVSFGLDSVDVTNWGLKCNKITKQCDVKKFPGSLQMIEFSNSRQASEIAASYLKTRTKEGLAIGLHVAFQYQLIRTEIAKLYAMNNLNYEQTFVRIARDIILQSAGNYEAPKFWKIRNQISSAMQLQLDEELKKAHARCIYLQILDIELPEQYENSLVVTQVEIQNRRIKEFEQQAQIIKNEILVLRSQNDQEIFTINAKAKAGAYLMEQQAQAQSNQIQIEAEAKAYQQIKEMMKLTDSQFSQYLYYQSLLSHPEQMLLVNSPATLTYQLNNRK